MISDTNFSNAPQLRLSGPCFRFRPFVVYNGIGIGKRPQKSVFLRSSCSCRGAQLRDKATVNALPQQTDAGNNPLSDLLKAGNITKTAVSKLTVAELRGICHSNDLPTSGLKAELVERVLGWALQQSRRDIQQTKREPQLSSSAEPTPSSTHSGTEPLSGYSEAEASLNGMRARIASSASMPSSSTGSESGTEASSTQQSRAGVSPLAGAAKDVKVTWLGTSSGAPTSRRNVSCIVVRYGEESVFLVDCGEGTRNQLRLAGLNPALITHIFITHMHGDHCFGLPGTLAAISTARAGTPLENQTIQVFGPPELHKLVIAACKSASLQLTTPVVVRGWVFDPEIAVQPTSPVDPRGKLYLGHQAADQASDLPPDQRKAYQSEYNSGADDIVRRGLTWTTRLPCGLRVTAAQLQHRVPCWGYVFAEPNEAVDISPDAAGIRSDVKLDSDDDSTTEEDQPGLLIDKWIRPGRKIVILGDTCNSSAIADVARGCDLLSHEATFNRGFEEKARLATHSTAAQAGAFARSVRARTLVLTHFSARYEQADPYKKVWVQARRKGLTVREFQTTVVTPLLEEAREMAGDTRVYLAKDFYTFTVPSREPVREDKLRRRNVTSSKKPRRSEWEHSSSTGAVGRGVPQRHAAAP